MIYRKDSACHFHSPGCQSWFSTGTRKHCRYFRLEGIQHRELGAPQIAGRDGGVEARGLPLGSRLQDHPSAAVMRSYKCRCQVN